jgi:hypothetical protein
MKKTTKNPGSSKKKKGKRKKEKLSVNVRVLEWLLSSLWAVLYVGQHSNATVQCFCYTIKSKNVTAHISFWSYNSLP